MNHSLIFVTGGAYSGKSEFLHRLIPHDSEAVVLGGASLDIPPIRMRVDKLKSQRPPSWTSLDAPFVLESMIELVRKPSDIFAFDSVSHWLCNYTADLSTGYDECKVEESLAVFCSEFLMEIQRLRLEKDIVIVSTDFSQGPPPSDAQTRLVRQYNGIMSQGIAALAKQVFVLIAGCPMLIKG